MRPEIFAILASLMYLYAFGRLWRMVKHPEKPLSEKPLLGITLLALLFHGLALSQTLLIEHQLNLHLGNILSLMGWLTAALVIITSLTQPVLMLGIFIFPLTALSSFMPFWLVESHPIALKVGSHILLSIGAYSVLTLATAQAILYSIQEARFKQKKVGSVLNVLPPLQIMEKTLIQLIWIGFIFLSLSLFSGFLFVDNLLAQHLVHKTFFSILAWFTYALFLWGYYQRGWRGKKAARALLWAYTLLFLGYIGTSFILLMIYN